MGVTKWYTGLHLWVFKYVIISSQELFSLSRFTLTVNFVREGESACNSYIFNVSAVVSIKQQWATYCPPDVTVLLPSRQDSIASSQKGSELGLSNIWRAAHFPPLP